MSSGINWMYQISNSNPEEVPIRYCVGLAWASGEKRELIVGLVHGLTAVRTAYSSLPGLAYHRELWLRARLSGPEVIVDAASKYKLDLFAQKLGKRSPLTHGGHNIETCTIQEWIVHYGFVCGREIAEHAGLGLEDKFLDVWERFALSAEEYPNERWGVCPRVKTLKVVDISRYGEKSRELGYEEGIRVLDAAEAWARAHGERSVRQKADSDIAHLLDEEVLKGNKPLKHYLIGVSKLLKK